MRTRVATLIVLAVLSVVLLGDTDSGTRLSDDPVDSRLPYNFARAVATGDAGDVHAVWFDTGVRYRRSVDDGRSWLDAVALSDEGTIAQAPAVASAGGNVYVAWHEIHAQVPRIMFRRSRDRGATWDSPQSLTDPRVVSTNPSIAAAGARVHVTWFDSRHGLSEIYTRHSTDVGSTWQREQRISESNAESWVATIETREADVLIGWVDYIDGNEEEYLRRSVDGGESWEAPVRFTDDDADSWAPSIAISGDVVLVSWFDRRAAGVSDADVESKLNEALVLVGLAASSTPPRDPQIYYLPLFTARLQEKQNRLSAAVPAWIAGGGNRERLEEILADFERLFRRWAYGWEIYYRRSTDRGRTFGAVVRLTEASGASQRPSIVMRGAEVSVVWFDDREEDETFDIYMKSSFDGGITWSGEKRLTHGSAVMPSAARSRDAIHIVWTGLRDGAGDIHYQRIPMNVRRRSVSP